MNFPCTNCGACCRRAHLVKDFNYSNKIKGGCIYLTENLCEIYDNRPLICNMAEVKKVIFPNISQKEYYRISGAICNELIKKDEMDSKYLVDLKQFED